MPHFLLFEAASRRFAVRAERVVQVLRAAAPAPLAGAPPVVRGVLDVHGALLPVIDVRVALGDDPGRVRASDQLVLVDDGEGPVALLVDRVLDVREASHDDVTGCTAWSAGAALAEGALRLADGAVAILSVERWVELARAAAAPPASPASEGSAP